MDTQAIFNTVATHLFTQGEQALGYNDGANTCLYRGSNGQKCAVGVLIPDEDYTLDIEGTSAHDAIELLAKTSKRCAELYEHTAFLDYLQAVHDGPENWKSTRWMRRALYEVADLFEIDGGILETLAFADR